MVVGVVVVVVVVDVDLVVVVVVDVVVADFSSVQTFSPSPPSILKAWVEARLRVTMMTSLMIKRISAPDP